MRKAFLVSAMQLLISSVLIGQATTRQLPQTAKVLTYSEAKGSWKFELFANNISKTTFRPAGYNKNELTSNAVILKPATQGTTTGLQEGVPSKLGEKIIVLHKDNMLHFELNGETIAILHETFNKDGFHSFSFNLQQDEKIFGGGERALPMDRRGYRFNLYNNPWYGYEYGADNLNFSVPFFISNKGYGIFFDNASKGYVDIGKANSNLFEAGFVSGELNFYIIPGKNVDEIMQSYTKLTGRQPLPPRWVFGNFMSRFGYRSQDQVTEIYARMKDEGFPMDAIIFDLFWFGDSIKGTMGNLDWVNKEKWPDPKEMIDNFKQENIKTILITEPFVLASTPNYEPSRKFHTVDSNGMPFTLADFYFGEGGLIDIFRNDAQDWFWTKYQAQIQNGVAGWWGDLGEPEKHPATTYHNLSDLGFSRKFSADEVHNLYGHYWSKMLHEKYAGTYPNTRLFHLNRSGFAGSQRYSVFPWTGDVHRNWNGFKAQLPILLGMSLSGIPYIHSDAGGFAMGEKDPELYTRWLQFAAFTPVFRPHGTAFGDVDPSVQNIESEPVFYPEPYKSIVKKIIERRYELSPYNYTLAYEQQSMGRPLMRPMFYHYPEHDAYEAGSQYMWGEYLLVAPVFEKETVEKKLYLPKGSWFDLYNNVFVEGNQWLNLPAGIEDVPVLAKEGAFIPTVGGLMNLEKYSTRSLNVLYVPSAKQSTYTLYDDDGITNNAIAKKQFELLQFSGKSAAGVTTISLKSNGGKFNGRPASRNITFRIPGINKKPSSVMLNGVAMKASTTSTAASSYYFDDESKTLFVSVPFSSAAIKVDIKK
jgi:oligosaccharide 4-alpha-D-glucosyltransferase